MSSQPRRYMSKRQRPCDFCRSRKTACRIDQAPPCRLCVLHGRDCTFVEAAAPRKRPVMPDGQEGTADAVTVQEEASSQGANAASTHTLITPTHIPPKPSGRNLSEDTSMDFVGDFNFDTTQSEFEAMLRSPHAAGTPSSLLMQGSMANFMPSERDAGYSDGANPQLMGLSGDMDPLLLRHYRYDATGMFGFKELAIHSVQDSPIPFQFLVSRQSLFSRRREEAGIEQYNEAELKRHLEVVIPADVGKRLIHLFGEFINPRWPMFSEAQYPDPKSTPAYLLAAIYAISLPFAVHDDKLSVDVAYDKPPHADLSQIIDKALTYEIHSPSLAIVQTLLLLILRPSSDPLVSDAAHRWDLLGRLVACATTLGLHLDPSPWSITAPEIAKRRQIAFFIYAADKWLACSLGRPPLVNDDNWLVTALERKDLANTGLQPEAESRLVGFSDRTRVLSLALSKLYSLRAVDELSRDQAKTSAITQQLLADLSSLSDSSHSASCCKDLEHSYVRLTILRAELRPWMAGRPSPGWQQNETMELAESPRKSMKECLDTLSDIIRNLSPDTDSVFWPPWSQFIFSSVCFTLMTMAVTSPSFDEASSWIANLQSTRKSLRLKVVSFPFLRLGLLRIDALFWRGIPNVLHLEPHVAEAFTNAESRQ